MTIFYTLVYVYCARLTSHRRYLSVLAILRQLGQIRMYVIYSKDLRAFWSGWEGATGAGISLSPGIHP